ncbi:MAG: HAMP domain-containing histidine kinase [Tannerellaceae bacterium]|jgi:two-component system phosphate regulon sensor histidine kinase PhoR|nr:HAMP domain-containing histidine kinase [Tannerellaceae bacterium]
MRKSTIWLLTVVMAFAFIGLLYLQMNYVGIIVGTYNTQFNATVKTCLNRVTRDLERDEIRRHLEQDILRDERARYHSDELKLRKIDTLDLCPLPPFGYFAPRHLAPVKSRGLMGGLQNMQSNFVHRYFKRNEMINDVINEMLYSAALYPVEERINFKKLERDIEIELKNNGLPIPFVFFVVNKDGFVVYRNDNGETNPSLSDLYTQTLFPNDPTARLAYLRLYLPTRESYISNRLTFIIPSIIFSALLLIVFSVTLFIIFRQKKLSEIKNDFINNMTHELKTPVSSISLAAQMLKDSDVTKNPDDFHHIANVITDETRRLSFLIEKVLQISLFDRHQSSLKLKEIDANNLIVATAKTFALKVKTYEGTLDIDLQAKDSAIYADEMHITNVLFNLLDNAVKYRRSDVPLCLLILTRNENNKLIISVEDNGISIKKEHLKKVFDRFYRVPTGNVHNVKGFGLGLAYVRQIVENHKGSIRAEIGHAGIGTKFIISLPLIK